MDATDDVTAFRLFSDIRMGIEGNRAHGRHTMSEGEKRFCALSWTEGLGGPHTVEQAEDHLERTSHFWRTWLADGTYPDHPWRFHLQRSALVLKGLTFMPTGALVAAPTTSLPETPRGERNWDYRYCWMRDASFTLWGLHALGLNWEADDFVQYLADMERNEDGSLQIMYGIKGQKDLAETTLDHLKGYEGARPVRIGNGAYNQRQNDVYGAVLDSVYLHAKKRDHIPERLWPVLTDQVECAAARVARARPGDLGGARRAAPLRLLEADVLGRARPRRAPGRTPRRRASRREEWQALADEIRADILEQRRRRARRLPPALRHRRSSTRPACWCRSCASCPPEDERVRATVMAIRDELTEGGLVLRYRTEATDDGLQRRGGHVPDLLLLAGLGALGDRRAPRGRAPVRAPALLLLAAGALRRGARGLLGAPPRQLPPGVHAPRADQRGHARDRRAAAGVIDCRRAAQ